jgi:hypothetical protein
MNKKGARRSENRQVPRRIPLMTDLNTRTIDDCRIGHFTGNGVHLEHIWCFSLRHSMLHNNRGTGLYIDGWDAFICKTK